ncbi:MAG: AbrB/MazE/SpoVT family DNA-binding domain-containing protein [Patescibacteria group bacterium]
MLQKVIKVGNSAAVTIPKYFLEKSSMKIGDKVFVEFDEETNMIVISPKSFKGITPEFIKYTNDYIKRNRKALEELAKL